MPGLSSAGAPAEHTMLVERFTIEEPTTQILQAGPTDAVSCPINVRTTIYTKTINVPSGKTQAFIAAFIDSSAATLSDTWIAIDGVDIGHAQASVGGWKELTVGEHLLTIDARFSDGDGFAFLGGVPSCIMVCRVPGSKYVSFGDEVTVLTKEKLVKAVVGVKGFVPNYPYYAGGYVKTIDKFGNVVDKLISGEWTDNPILYEAPFADNLTLKIRTSSWLDFWISYLALIYEL